MARHHTLRSCISSETWWTASLLLTAILVLLSPVWQPNANDANALQHGADTGLRSPHSQYICKDGNVAMCCLVLPPMNVNSDIGYKHIQPRMYPKTQNQGFSEPRLYLDSANQGYTKSCVSKLHLDTPNPL